MRHAHLFLSLFTLFTFYNISFGQKNVSYKNQQWIQYYNNLKLSDKFIMKSDVGFRTQNNFENASQYVSRVGLSYKIMPQMQVGGGFALFGFYTNEKVSKLEYRPYQELLINDKYNKFKIQHRFRTEQRFFTTATNNSFNHRLRYRFLVTIPILDFSEKRKGSELALNLSDEVFINTGKEVVYNVFAQNRVLLGATYNWDSNLAFTLTYISEFASNNAANSYNYSNILWLGVQHNINKLKSNKNETPK